MSLIEPKLYQTPAEVIKLLDILKIALVESVNLQSHYARLLNDYDGGSRLDFKSANEWIERLIEIGKIKK